jgi:hypothetical protein
MLSAPPPFLDGQHAVGIDLLLELIEEGRPRFGSGLSRVVSGVQPMSADAPNQCGPFGIEAGHEKRPPASQAARGPQWKGVAVAAALPYYVEISLAHAL